MSADDIQKAKMRALFMQSKYGKSGSKESSETKIDSPYKQPQTNPASIAACSSKVPTPPKIEENEKPLLLASKATNKLEASYSKPKMDVKEPLWEKCKRVQIPWRTPAGTFAIIFVGSIKYVYNIRIEKLVKFYDSPIKE